MIQRRQLGPLSGEAKRPKGMTNDDWEELDLLAPDEQFLGQCCCFYPTNMRVIDKSI